MLRSNTFIRCACLLTVGLVSACGSGNDTSPIAGDTVAGDPQETGVVNSPVNDDPTNGGAGDTGAESTPAEVEPVQGDPVETVNSDTGDTGQNDQNDQSDQSGDAGDTGDNGTEDASESTTSDSTETELADTDADGENSDGQQETSNTDSEGAPTEPPAVNNQRINFSNAKLLLDVVPDGNSYPAKFHRAGDHLYFWTVDTDPRFANCAWHWSNLNDDDKSIGFNLVAVHPDTGFVTMNEQIMTLGDFAEDANNACAGYNGTVMDVYEQTWMTPSSSGEQQFIVHFDGFGLGPDQFWKTDGSGSNTSLVETGQEATEEVVIEGDKVFFISRDGLSVSDSLSGDRRKLFERSEGYGYTVPIVRSSARQATFEIEVGGNRSQIWTYDLDTDEVVKQFSIKPDEDTYRHEEVLLVDGETIVSKGNDRIGRRPALGISHNYGDITSFEILTESVPAVSGTDLTGEGYSKDQFLFNTSESNTISVWSYRDGRTENLFSISDVAELVDLKIIAGHDGRIYVTGVEYLGPLADYDISLKLWAFDPQTEQLVKLSGDHWYAFKQGYPTRDEAYLFRYLNTRDGLLFVNLTEGSGRELWFADGTPGGTRQITDINPGDGNSDPENFYQSGDKIYFSANDGIHGQEPWMIQISR